MSENIKIFALGGLDEQGKNLTVVEIDGDIIILDCGFKFPNKLTPGIDFLIPNPSYIKENKDRVVAYVLSHSHDEQIGALPYFYSYAPAPIYTTRATKNIITKGNLFNKKVMNYDFKIIEPTSEHNINGHKVSFFQTYHNTLESFGVCIHTSLGNIVYPGEYIVSYDTKYPAFSFDIHALNTIAQEETLLLMNESLGARYEGYCSPHHKFTPHIEQYFIDSPGRIFIALFWQNFYNLFEILELCVSKNKKIVFYDQLTKKIILDIIEQKNINIPANCLIDYADVLRYREQDEVFIMVDNSEYIFYKVKDLCYRRNEDKRIFLNENDTFLLCTPPSDNIEDLFSETVDDLFLTGAKIVYLKRKDVASMHARQDDLKLMLSLLKPKYYLPVRGSYTQMLENAKLAVSMGIGLNHTNVFILENGMILNFLDGKPRIYTDKDVDATETIVDGFGVGDVQNDILEERNKIGENGVVVIASSISLEKRALITKPDCQMRGFVFVKDAEPLLRQITSIYIEEILNEFNRTKDGFDNARVCEIISEKAGKIIRHYLRREPVIVPIIIEEA